LLLGTGAVAAGAERPNILVIMGDDIGIWNISRYSIGQWLFADSMAGARASANLYGLIETAKANRIEPSRYLAQLFEILPAITEPEQLDDLLPQNIDPRDLRSPEI